VVLLKPSRPTQKLENWLPPEQCAVGSTQLAETLLYFLLWAAYDR
jgi:hypothetical protein